MALSHGVPLIKRSGQVIYKSAQEENSTREADDRTDCKIDTRGYGEGVEKGGGTGRV